MPVPLSPSSYRQLWPRSRTNTAQHTSKCASCSPDVSAHNICCCAYHHREQQVNNIWLAQAVPLAEGPQHVNAMQRVRKSLISQAATAQDVILAGRGSAARADIPESQVVSGRDKDT